MSFEWTANITNNKLLYDLIYAQLPISLIKSLIFVWFRYDNIELLNSLDVYARRIINK